MIGTTPLLTNRISDESLEETRAPVAVVASLRETSILFATGLSVLVLATGLIVLGVIVVRALQASAAANLPKLSRARRPLCR